jgi:molybdenum cofactor cytidylyltransferase
MEERFCFGALILAAGRSSRMGKPKLLLPWGDTSILGHLLQQWGRLNAQQIAVVCARGDQPICAELDRLGFPAWDRIENPVPERGMFSSIQCASLWCNWKQSLTHWAFILGDQPHLRHETLNSVLECAVAQSAKVVQPTHRGRRRHPVLLPKPIFLELQHSTACHLKEFLTRFEAVLVECDDPGLDLDLDRPEDYNKALALAPKK